LGQQLRTIATRLLTGCEGSARRFGLELILVYQAEVDEGFGKQ
jgi:hypothetical protein